jgi:hypothetical protein
VDVVVVVPVSRTQFPFTQIMPGTVPGQLLVLVVPRLVFGIQSPLTQVIPGMGPPGQLEVLLIVPRLESGIQLPLTQVMPGTVPVHPPELVVGSVPVG